MSNQPFQTIKETSRTTGLSQYYLRKACARGAIPFIMCGKKYMINVPGLLERLNNDSSNVLTTQPCTRLQSKKGEINIEQKH